MGLLKGFVLFYPGINGLFCVEISHTDLAVAEFVLL